MLVQGEAPRDVLLRRFREAENAILLGTDSFWEGVDVPGRALRTLVLNKLPFKVPSEPLTAARLERLAEEGLGRLHELPAAPRGAQAQAGVRPPHPEPAGHGRGGPARQPGGHQAVRAAAAERPAAGGADHRQLGAGADQVRGLLCPAAASGRPYDPGPTVEDRRASAGTTWRTPGSWATRCPRCRCSSSSRRARSSARATRSCCPPSRQRVEFEAEIGVVIGTPAPPGRRADAAERGIGGYVCVNDVTCRDLQKTDGQWGRAKGFDTFCPVGPRVATGLDWRDARGDRPGERRRSGSARRPPTCTSRFPMLVSFISGIMTLEPGDLIATGTPAGVGPLQRRRRRRGRDSRRRHPLQPGSRRRRPMIEFSQRLQRPSRLSAGRDPHASSAG